MNEVKYESNHFICLRHGYCHIHGGNRKVMEYCKEHGLNVNYSQTNVASLPGNTDGVALVVSTTKVPYELDVPVVNGLPINTGIGEEKVLAQIVSILKK